MLDGVVSIIGQLQYYICRLLLFIMFIFFIAIELSYFNIDSKVSMDILSRRISLQLTKLNIMAPLIVIDQAKPNFPPMYPDSDGPMNAPRAEDELKNPEIIPYN